MIRALFKATPLFAAAVLNAACASAGGPAAQSTGQVPCAQGDAVIVVRNQTNAVVQIVESRTGSGLRSVIGEVPPGRHELRIRNDYSYAYAAQRVDGSGGVLAVTSRPRRLASSAVRINRECR
ncbi:MAG TPA: hypothetical protein VGX50_18600, partial [Longimicrobium sp.]|nr:hypothetical protein [Longimicrobium sp.]